MGRAALVTLLTACLLAPTARAGATDPLHVTFAECAGRLAARAEFQRMTGDPALPLTQHRAASMEDVMKAIAEDAAKAETLRRQAKGAMAALLLHARYGTDAGLADHQASEADRLTASCEALLPH